MELCPDFLLLCLFALAAVQKANGCSKKTKKPVDGKFGAWSEWTLCDVSCGTGSHERERHCNNPRPRNKGKKCSGAISQTRPCYVWKDYCRESCFSFPVTDASAGIGARVILNPLRKLNLTSFTLDLDVTMHDRWPLAVRRRDLRTGPTLVGFSRVRGIGRPLNMHISDLLWLTADVRLVINGDRVLEKKSRGYTVGLQTPEIKRKERYTVTWDGKSGKTELYTNGKYEGEATAKQQQSELHSIGEGELDSRGIFGPGVFILGQQLVKPWQKYAALQQFMGDLCNFQMWDRVLTKGELKSLFQGKAVTPANVFDNPPTYEFDLKGGAKVKS